MQQPLPFTDENPDDLLLGRTPHRFSRDVLATQAERALTTIAHNRNLRRSISLWFKYADKEFLFLPPRDLIMVENAVYLVVHTPSGHCYVGYTMHAVLLRLQAHKHSRNAPNPTGLSAQLFLDQNPRHYVLLPISRVVVTPNASKSHRTGPRLPPITADTLSAIHDVFVVAETDHNSQQLSFTCKYLYDHIMREGRKHPHIALSISAFDLFFSLTL